MLPPRSAISAARFCPSCTRRGRMLLGKSALEKSTRLTGATPISVMLGSKVERYSGSMVCTVAPGLHVSLPANLAILADEQYLTSLRLAAVQKHQCTYEKQALHKFSPRIFFANAFCSTSIRCWSWARCLAR